MLPGVTRMKGVSTETPREASDRSVRATHCEQRLQLREQKNTYRDFKNSQDALMQSEPCTCRIQTVRRGQVVRIAQQATGVQLLNVEQE